MADAAQSSSEREPLLAPAEAGERGDTSRTAAWRASLADGWHRTTSTLHQWTASLLPSSSSHAQRTADAAEGEEADEAELERRLARKTAWQRTAQVAGVGLFSLFLLVLVLGAVVLGHLFFITLRGLDESKQSAILSRALALKGPDRLSLLNLTSDGVQVQLDARLGLDPDEALDEWLGQRGSRSAWQNLERRWLEWGLRKVKGIRIDVVDSIVIAEPDWSKDLPNKHLHLIDGGNKKKKKDDHSAGALDKSDDGDKPPANLLGFEIEPLYIRLPPLRSRRAKDGEEAASSDEDKSPANHPTHRSQTNLTPLNLTLLLKPLVPIPHLVSLVESSMQRRKATLDIHVPGLIVRGLNERDMREGERRKLAGETPVRRDAMRFGWGVAGWISLKQGEMVNRVTEHVPDVSLGNDTSKLLELTHYDFFEIGADASKTSAPSSSSSKAQGLAAVQEMVHNLATRALGIRADAVAKNPLGKLLHGHVRYQLPFGVYLPIDEEQPEPEPEPAPPGAGDGSQLPKKAEKKKPMHGDPDDTSSVLMAVVATEPLDITGEKHIALKLQGRVVPPPPPSSKAASQGRDLAGAEQQVPFLSGAAAPSAQSGDEVRVAETPQEKALSNFLSKFLRGDPNTVFVRGGSPWSRMPKPISAALKNGSKDDDLPGDGSPDLPSWIGSALGIVDLPISFPGSKVTDLIKDVTISDLHFTAHPFEKDRILCSGTVMGTLNLPKELGGVDVKVTELWPDILVFDGKPPSMRKPHHGDGNGGDGDDGDDGDNDDDDDYYDGISRISRRHQLRPHKPASPPSSSVAAAAAAAADDPQKPTPSPDPIPPLPDPLPQGAFGRLRPHDFTPATTVPDPSDPSGARKLLRCELVNVPFTVLPERQKEFRAFAWKILTGGATAGIEGSARARIWNSGLGVLELYNLPVKGTFPVNPPSSSAASSLLTSSSSLASSSPAQLMKGLLPSALLPPL
ncbi:hypothetical protein OC842_005817 [Tilletia horrida]|uniref:Uncharacterized protein n=1 Tax=Tilletia horrida TaxID=155126 RepID=A0AAN6G752_9BASI|nr:hypothetical protein OC842_005817 [Tilletia horrida]